MSKVKSISVGTGDMFYIKHNSDNFTIIDCCMADEAQDRIVSELKAESKNKGIHRFISTHPDEDHILGLDYLDSQMSIVNFYCVKNAATKKDETINFTKYCKLRDSDKAFYIYNGCSRKWMNIGDNDRGASGINILWPVTSNKNFEEALKKASAGESPNNISPIIKYGVEDGVVILWMGDLETSFMESIINEITLPKVDILFAPHHGRDSGKVPEKWLTAMSPKIIVIGEAPSAELNYYKGYNTITQNTAGDITFDCDYSNKVLVYVSNEKYSVNFLDKEQISSSNYLGTLYL